MHGLFETLHGHAKASTLADTIKAATGRFYGTAGRAWLQHLTAEPERFATDAREVQAAFVAEHVPDGANGQVRRAAARFGLVAAAGELATAAGILPWQPGEAERAAAACFKAWRDARQGGNGAAEDAAAVVAVRRFIAAHGDGRFQIVGSDNAGDSRTVFQRAGWKKRDGDGWLYLIQPDVWRGEVVAGMDPKAAAGAVHRAGYLVPQNAGRLQKSERVGASEPVRCYVVRDAILSGEVAE